MNQNKGQEGTNPPNKGSQQDADKWKPGGQPDPDRSQADDKGQGLRRKPQGDEPAIPELPEPDVEGVGNEASKHTEATMPPGEGQNPKRNTM